ncbi:HYR domain-containing protein [Leifsonia poae]|uniref:HYR domain-containing protein n=1 Tax=Leifsonia poae TaxID=110933 RepID=UPI001CBC89A8|nr:HYR domain-containing protein [Leifsonia poae]
MTATPQVIDGNGTVLFTAAPYDVVTVTDGSSIVAPFTAAPTANPIIAGIYGDSIADGDSDNRSEFLGRCDGLPLAASIALSPAKATPTRTLPTFDVRFSEAVAGFDAPDLLLGGTAHPVGASVSLLTPVQRAKDYPIPLDTVGLALSSSASIYRVTITGVANDGTVTVGLPAGAVHGQDAAASTDTNLAVAPAAATIDTTGPALRALPDLIRQLSPGETSVPIIWADPAVDPADVADEHCSSTSGSAFAAGDTLVTCTARDALGNVSSTSFTARVRAAQTPAVHLAPEGATAPAQGGTSTFSISATDYTGATSPLPAADYSVVSSVSSDEITKADGSFAVGFPHASPHTITVTQLSTGATAVLTVQVTPAKAVVVPAGPGDATTGGREPTGTAAGDATPLAATGSDPIAALLAAATLLLVGATTFLIARRRRMVG